MKILVINCGSSSFKYQLFDMDSEIALCSGQVERIGQEIGMLSYKKAPDTANEKKHLVEENFADHTKGLESVMALITDTEWGVLKNLEEIRAVGHRVVQGGELLKKSCIVTDYVKEKIGEMISLAPLHNPANLQGIEVAQKLLPNTPSVAVFDTEFHSTIPAKAYMYALPYKFYEEMHIRRYGFHGTSHRYVSEKAAKFFNKPIDQFSCISCHLGNGASVAAIKNGICVDTSMGMTPLAGLMMGTRCGSIDPAIYAYIHEHTDLSVEEIDNMMNTESGLKGICGFSDMRDIHAACQAGDEKAKLAIDMFVYNIVRYIGSYRGIIGKPDAIIMTAGIGENDEIVRDLICHELKDSMGIIIDESINIKRSKEERIITKPESRNKVMVIPTNEELAIAKISKQFVK